MSQRYPLQLSATPGAWRLFAARKQDPKFAKFAEKILQRDNYACRFCGFQAKDFQEIVNLDQNYYNNKQRNLVTACCFCTQCLFLDAVGVGDFGGGTLVYLPELAQPDLNSFCHVLFCAITNDTGYKDSAQGIYRNLKFRTQLVEEQFGEGTGTPSVMGQLIIESCLAKPVMEQVLSKVRLLPSRGRFRTQIEHWAAAALEEVAHSQQE